MPVDDVDDVDFFPRSVSGVVKGEEELEATRDGGLEGLGELNVGLLVSRNIPDKASLSIIV